MMVTTRARIHGSLAGSGGHEPTEVPPLKLAYFAPADIQIARVDRQCIVSFCSALDQIGVNVELVAMRITLRRDELRGADPLSLYRLRRAFPITLIRVPVGQESSERWLALNRLVVHAVQAVRMGLKHRDRTLAFYTKTYSTAATMLALRRLLPSRPRVAFEAHLPPQNALQRFVLGRADRVIANSHALGRDLRARGDVAPERLLSLHQGVDTELIRSLRMPANEARARLGLPPDRRLIVYTGKIYEGYEEVEYLLSAARALEAREDILFVLVGGRADHVARLRERAVAEGRRNVTFVGFVAPSVVQEYQFAADALVLYYPSGSPLNDYRSPGKLFEYMASGAPIVTVDLPVLREVLGEDPAAAVVPPDSPKALAAAIAGIIEDRDRATRLAAQASKRVESFSWRRRADAVVAFLGDAR
jgi:glycosyltransferase involved in cell wall biosynthesis